MVSDSDAAQEVSRTVAFQGLFTPHPLAYSRLLELNDTKKYAPLVNRAATVADYLEHLAPESYGGVGALGMFPGLRATDKQGKQRWFGTFFAIDFDGSQTFDVEPLVHTLEGEGIPVYLTCGTTGRGSHLYGFVEGLVPQRKVHAVVKAIQTMAEAVGLGVPEIRPSCELGRGSPIFLPYRGALKDGYGFNPLLDPTRDLEPVKLEHAIIEVQRVSTKTLERFRLKMAARQHPVRMKRATSEVSAGRKLEVADGLTALHTEFERVVNFFKEPYRQDLVMALSAYGVRCLELDAGVVREEVTAFIKKHDSDELARRLAALERTLSKYARSPRSVAWTSFYRRVGLIPPGKLGVSKEVVARLEVAARQLSSRPWKGSSGLSDYSIFVALLRVGADHGALHPAGVQVSISVRDLALKAGVGDKTAVNALKRLKVSRMVVREHRPAPHDGKAGVLVIVVAGVFELPHSFPLVGGLKEWGHLYTHAAFRHGKLGKSAAPVLVACLHEGRALARTELAKVLGRDSRALRNPLAKLMNHDILVKEDTAYVLHPRWDDALERAAVVTGAYQTEERQRATHQAERLVFHARFRSFSDGEELLLAA